MAIPIEPATERGYRVWALALELAVALGDDLDWSLIGGLMVELHAVEHGARHRPTLDIDLLASARESPPMTERMAAVLIGRGAAMAAPPRSDPTLGYRFEISGEIVEILAPDGLAANPRTVGSLRAVQVPGGTQALRRTEVVHVSLASTTPVAVRRPSLLGAILIKARAVAARRREKLVADRQDLIRLLGCVEDPRGLAEKGALRPTERRWLRRIDAQLDLENSADGELFPADVLWRARRALLLLTAPGRPSP